MDIETIRNYCLSKPGTSEGMPFDDCVLVFKVGGKMFALMNICNFGSINLKYYEETIEELRAQNSAVNPGYHMSKKHWNTIELEITVWNEVKEWIDISYQLIYDKLTKKAQAGIQNQ
jgi:predicted DNA-binding protein (MmcQ/YjbR family)